MKQTYTTRNAKLASTWVDLHAFILHVLHLIGGAERASPVETPHTQRLTFLRVALEQRGRRRKGRPRLAHHHHAQVLPRDPVQQKLQHWGLGMRG